MRLQIQARNASTSGEIDAAFATIGRERPDALFVGAGPFFTTRRLQLAHWATRVAIPATFSGRQYAEAGGLMSYGTSLAGGWRQVGVYAGRILKGAKPGDLPVVQSSKFELVINAQTARMLGLTVPPSLLSSRRRSDRITRRICPLLALRLISDPCLERSLLETQRTLVGTGSVAIDPKQAFDPTSRLPLLNASSRAANDYSLPT